MIYETVREKVKGEFEAKKLYYKSPDSVKGKSYKIVISKWLGSLLKLLEEPLSPF